ncbi:peptide-methionine (R)-S-oxide reductase MsrB [Planctomycetota bacterium]
MLKPECLLIAAMATLVGVACPDRKGDLPTVSDRIEKSDAEWRAQLTREQFCVLREKGTEPAFSGGYWDHKVAGTYRCAGCGQELFSSTCKFDSGTGWPSFSSGMDEAEIGTSTDRSLGMVRTEVTCGRCGAHLGHVFPDGPPPANLRYCVNSLALDFVPAEKDPPQEE